ncbi:hypothetical protein PGT21_018806 [Puccinia graminis f. sp. tritici]|uniref:Cyanovirin-N domain-containing protein n=1 Tax=Puccinia graminis f. sp. tritici TaxID=56615 RepID=A0A5B0Q3S3_PUCGR|nr:hypothetical protein PGT21_018806 [Puccinia graminis f. sp. tritici]KAA1124625.1 hypothetical protein PGTUg99_024075 [Puccinia graminis f. sp. tritici]
MSFLNLFQGGYITFALLALIIALHSGQAGAVATRTTRQCGYHFGPNDRYVQKASCMQTNTQDHLCSFNSCWGGLTRYSAMFFSNCHRNNGAQKKDRVFLKQYFRRDKWIEVQDIDDHLWWNCDYADASDNGNFITCYDCSS